MLPETPLAAGRAAEAVPCHGEGGARGVWNPSPPTPSDCSPSPPKLPGSLCQGDISISPVSMTTQRQVSARRMREPARATWGPLPTGRPRWARTHGLGVPRWGGLGGHGM